LVATFTRILAPVKNLSKITALKLCQVVLRTQLCLNALSQKKSVKRYWGPFERSTVPFSCKTSVILGQLPSITWPSPGEALQAVHESVGDRCGHRGALTSFLPSAKGHHGRCRVALPADNPEEERRALLAQGKITQLATAQEVQ
jgi:hypothetical protein